MQPRLPKLCIYAEAALMRAGLEIRNVIIIFVFHVCNCIDFYV